MKSRKAASEQILRCAQNDKRELVIALAGNPNSGKTTVFNEMTGSHQHVGNWPGVTVERKEGTLKIDGRTLRIVDLPGIYSLTARSQEEVIARDFLIDDKVDVIINIVDASNLDRNLYLTTQLLELGIPMVVALNMIDMSESHGQKIDMALFSSLLGVPVVATVGHRGEGIQGVMHAAILQAECPSCDLPRSTRHSPEIEVELSRLQEEIKCDEQDPTFARWLLIKSLEGDEIARQRLMKCVSHPDAAIARIDAVRHHLEKHFGDDLEAVIAGGRYGFIGGLMREVVSRTKPLPEQTATDRIDNIILSRVFGIPIFLVIMWLTFKLTFDVGGLLKHQMDVVVAAFSAWVSGTLPHGPLSSLLVNGIIAGVGGVIVFLPNIAVMFAIISFLEGSGYMARAAFLMDRSMHKLGLHGKSFIPMLMGFGCNVPAIMAARTLETREDRLLTILVTPLISCSARLPIYILFTGVFFSENGAWVIFSMYALGILLAVVSGKLFRKLFFAKSVSPFVMELPPYRMPTLKGTIMYMWERSSMFLSKAGTLILAAAVVMWALGSLPWGVTLGSENSLIGQIGRAIEPLVRPLGLDWRAAVALLFGMGAKEIVVSTLGVLYSSGSGTGGLQSGLAHAYTPLLAYTFMVISLIYIPCVAALATIRRETNSWKWTLISAGYSLILAYAIGFAVYRVGLMVGFK